MHLPAAPALLPRHSHLPIPIPKESPHPSLYPPISSLTAPPHAHLAKICFKFFHHPLLRKKIYPRPSILPSQEFKFFRKTGRPEGMLCTMKTNNSFSLEQLLHAKQTARHVAYPLHAASSQRSIRNFQ